MNETSSNYEPRPHDLDDAALMGEIWRLLGSRRSVERLAELLRAGHTHRYAVVKVVITDGKVDGFKFELSYK